MANFTWGVIERNCEIAPGIFDMLLHCPAITSQRPKPGQFLQLYLSDKSRILPRPISICQSFPQQNTVRLVYQAVGEGTRSFSRLKPGEALHVTGPLGNGFTLPQSHCSHWIVVGGGIGIPPLLQLCQEGKRQNPDIQIDAVLGFRSNVFLAGDFEALGVAVRIATDDGSVGFHGNTVELLEKAPLEQTKTQVYSCGPLPMLKALASLCHNKGIPLEVSMEERMACGIGACVGCAIPIWTDQKDDWQYKKVCKDGPVFNAQEVVWA